MTSGKEKTGAAMWIIGNDVLESCYSQKAFFAFCHPKCLLTLPEPGLPGTGFKSISLFLLIILFCQLGPAFHRKAVGRSMLGTVRHDIACRTDNIGTSDSGIGIGCMVISVKPILPCRKISIPVPIYIGTGIDTYRNLPRYYRPCTW